MATGKGAGEQKDPTQPKKPDRAIMVAVIGGLATVVAAGLTTWGTIVVNGKSIIDNSQKLEQLTNKTTNLDNLSVPVGTIVASMLTPKQFAKAAGDPDDFDLKTSKWTLADGKSVPGTAYAAIMEDGPVPDLRGVFLRGKKNGRLSDPNNHPFDNVGEFALGAYTADVVGPHVHDQYIHKNDKETAGGPGGGADGKPGIVNIGNSDRISDEFVVMRNNPNGENIPKNVTINYFIRINPWLPKQNKTD